MLDNLSMDTGYERSGVGVGRIKIVLEMVPEMIFKIDLNSRIGLREIDQRWWEDNSTSECRQCLVIVIDI